MHALSPADATDLAEAFAFLGNSLLAPMSQTSDIGLDPGFWERFPDFGNPQVRDALDGCFEFACFAREREAGEVDVVQEVSVEYTRLFVGPPRPAAPPWETFYRSEGASSGFGAPTFEMKGLLREAGLEIANSNNQYADHIGIELLYLSVLCERAQGGNDSASDLCRQFANDRLLTWIGKLQDRVEAAAPGGYHARVLALAAALLSGALDMPSVSRVQVLTKR